MTNKTSAFDNTSAGRPAFAFGKNWQAFRRTFLNEDRIREAMKSLEEFCGKDALRGKTFLDIGCGSGLFSLAAVRLGASRVVSFDIDGDCVACTETLRNDEGKPAHWRVQRGSILDQDVTTELGAFDIVYSWGVLHHTGEMWKALEHAMRMVKPGGLLYIAIYNRATGWRFYRDGRFGPSGFWRVEKRIYSSLPLFLQNAADYILMGVLVLIYLLTFRNPLKEIRGHKNLRGMSWRIDIKDWLGGYPYEYATAGEVCGFVEARGFHKKSVKENGELLNNEFLFQRTCAE